VALLGGQEIAIRKLNDTQMALAVREVQVLKSDRPDNNRRMSAIATLVNIIEKNVADEDRETFLDVMMSGDVPMKDVIALVAPENEDAAPAPVRRATRKR
jgi:hypothetical protein